MKIEISNVPLLFYIGSEWTDACRWDVNKIVPQWVNQMNYLTIKNREILLRKKGDANRQTKRYQKNPEMTTIMMTETMIKWQKATMTPNGGNIEVK